ncbi:hypothetical protein [Methylorubrum sp. DB1722]|uniref:hypothetical protein n=1 Tax=Methylorubrum sp. DB1722 TaxID=2478916 RepID=UPI0018E38D70|nr:hypothetical protein [Methylorubrum sp. DB1722]MBI1689527.1 hypothetical protein [Methylorubrum sp. DB1722]
MSDKLIQVAYLDGGIPADAFALGGRVHVAEISGAAPSSLDAVLPSAGSVFLLDVPPGRTLFVGHRAQVGTLSGDAARAVTFPLRAGTWTVTITDAGQVALRLLGDADFPLKILAAATVGGDA